MITSFIGSLDLLFFAESDLETIPNDDSADQSLIIGRNALRLLMMGWHSNWQDMVSCRLLKAIFFERDHQLVQGMRKAFQEGFSHLYHQLSSKTNYSEEELEQAHLFISNCLNLLPFSDLTPYESFNIPQWTNGQWQCVEYRVVPIELTATSGFEKLFIEDTDRVFAYGLEPINSEYAQSHLIFMGTTYPAGQGFISQVDSDLRAFNTVGNSLYQSGRKRISKWLDKQNQVHVCGLSLGASLSLLLALDKGHKLTRVDALNPAGLYDFAIKGHIDHWDKLPQKPTVIVQKQGKDPVSAFGVWKEDWSILHVQPPAEKQGPNPLVDHALNYAGLSGTHFDSLDPVADNREHQKRNFWLYRLGRAIVYLSFIFPFRYGILPLFRYVNSHKTHLLLTAIVLTLLITIPGFLPLISLGIMGLSSGFISALLFSIPLAFLLDRCLWGVSDALNGTVNLYLLDRLQWLKQPSVFITGLLLGIAAIAGMGAVVIFFGPAVFPSVILLSLMLPLAISALQKIIKNIHILRGVEKNQPAACHNPALPRNEMQDLYCNKQEETFSLSEIVSYYKAMRVLVKKKSFLPNEDQPREQFNGKSKREILLSLTETNGNSPVQVRASKAKIAEMKTCIKLLQKFGFIASQQSMQIETKELINELSQEYENYRLGKRQASFP
ncbi:hypothetical protein [Legionella jordanis]|uniref:Uncharacterized protein n=1 Tax=Legionella jordanis TaxID=456 RepID=A0A0W0V802_9GAMM|nr:hypothetical protein [Legionella jordanis]KTD16252.1 hypothetical protein Ljor_0558 [Legionella jordanis]RMX04530.1 hypothetical protein EAW55_03605 [Legionella jordanis]RMX21078.1 hypothetical protein EAS68_05065 [Legionella jordanis]VEH12290.1 Uncharacterised protein [Legionella jordanis]